MVIVVSVCADVYFAFLESNIAEIKVCLVDFSCAESCSTASAFVLPVRRLKYMEYIKSGIFAFAYQRADASPGYRASGCILLNLHNKSPTSSAYISSYVIQQGCLESSL